LTNVVTQTAGGLRRSAAVAADHQLGPAPRRAWRGAGLAAGRAATGGLVLLALWTLAAVVVGNPRALPPPAAVLSQAWADRQLYGLDLPPTLAAAGLGFVIGNGAAVLLGLLLALIPRGRRELMAIVVIFYNAPIIAVAPLVEVLLNGDWPKILMAALSVFFVTLVGTLAGFAAADPRTLDVVRAAGGGRWSTLWKVRVRAALPSTFAGIAAGVPFAIVGAMVGEFFGGQAYGLGVMLVAALDDLNAARVWGIALVVAVIGGAGLWLTQAAVRALTPWDRRSVIGSARAALSATRTAGLRARAASALASAAITVAVIIGVWVGGSKLLNLPPYVVRMPWNIWDYLFTGSGASANLSALLSSLLTSVGQALAGCVIGVVIGTAIAMTMSSRRFLRVVLLPPVVALSSVPYLALVPILSVAIGRGAAMNYALGAIIALLPTVVNLEAALSSAPVDLVDVLRASGARGATILRTVQVPAALPALFTALRIAAPWALYGVILAEFLSTGGGIGGAITNAAEIGDYNAAWAGAIAATIASALLYVSVGVLERAASDRFGIARSGA
jgi:sulfonate transport system permease protein